MQIDPLRRASVLVPGLVPGLVLGLVLAACEGPGPGGPARAATQVAARYFPDGAPWYEDLSGARVSPESAGITSWMVGQRPPGGWGTGRMQIDFGLVAVEAPDRTQRRAHRQVRGYHYAPDCDTAPVPVVPYGAVEETYGVPTTLTTPLGGYACSSFPRGGDCHMLFVARGERRLYEIYHATIDGDGDGEFHAGCLAIWETGRVAQEGRGHQCTSADAAGLPIAALLLTPEEVKAGEVNHALRFILPNDMIRARRYVWPATHGTDTSGPQRAGPYGMRLRLKADYPTSGLAPAAQVVARGLVRYGMVLSDGGNIAITAQSDLLSQVKWAEVGLEARSLASLKATDFEVLDFETPHVVTQRCERAQIHD